MPLVVWLNPNCLGAAINVLRTGKWLGKIANMILSPMGVRLVRSSRRQASNPVDRLVRKVNSTRAYNSPDTMNAFYSDRGILQGYFDDERLKFYADVKERVARLPLSPAKVIDVGCGSGHLLAQLRTMWPRASLLGIDFASESMALAHKLHPDIRFRQCNIFDVSDLNESFDLVLCTEVLEHLEDADLAIEKLLSICAPGGSVVITVPDGRQDTFFGHFNFWTVESFSREFKMYHPHVEAFGGNLFVVLAR